MSHPGPTGNGCSLEDCYTNLFALTDLCGIKWRKLTVSPECVSVEQLEDPVLVSYSKCIQSGILCVWRRVLRSSDIRSTDQLSKELWIFWYGDEPTGLESLLSIDLNEIERGSWDKDQKDRDIGLSYECRTLLFKALHNLIERCLLTKNFVRLGKWFVQPFDASVNSDRSAHLSFCFNFFLHGESQVCASIEIKQHPSVWTLTPQHLSLVQENQASFQVILAPYGLMGTLTGNTYRDTDQMSHKLFDEWCQFYPLDGSDSDVNKLPNLVEVLVAGVRMRYPSSYVLICDNDDSPVRLQPMSVGGGISGIRSQGNHSMMSNGPLSPPCSPVDPLLVNDSAVKVVPVHSMHHGMSDTIPTSLPNATEAFSHAITEKVSQDSCITTAMAKRTSDMSEEYAASQWHFAEPTSKVNCNCVRQRKLKSGSAGQGKNFVSGKHKCDKQEKLERQQSRHGRNSTPFHRRSPVTDDLMQFDMDLIMSRMPPNPAFCPTGGTTVQSQGRNTPNETNVDTPSAPSPLDEPQPLGNQCVDPPMPTLSPHPPTKVGGDKEFSGKSGVVPDAQGDACSGFHEFYNKREEGLTKNDTSSYHWNSLDSKNESVNNWLQSQHRHIVDSHSGPKRPSLPPKETDQHQDLVADSLYNFNPLQEWINLPVKKARFDRLMEGQSSDDQASNQSSHSQRHEQKVRTPSPVLDPYEFVDEPSLNPGTLVRGSRKSRDDRSFNRMDEDLKDSSRLCDPKEEKVNDLCALGSPSALVSMKYEKDLVPQESDLDHMFESSGDDSDEGGGTDSGLSGSKTTDELKCPKVGIIGPSELARMFPTPPSLENNKESSPEMVTDVMTDDPCYKVDIYQHVHTEDIRQICEFETDLAGKYTKNEHHAVKTHTRISQRCTTKQDVNKAPKFAKFVGAAKYSPVELPSSQLSPIPPLPEYKPSWQFPMPIMEKPHPHSSQYLNPMSIDNIPSLTSRVPGSLIESSPATFNNPSQQRTPRTPRTPLSYELQSPASNASSYLNKTLNSIDNHGTNNQIPEVHSLIVNVLLSDSILNLFKDHTFDSCNICVCHGNPDIKGADFGLYFPDQGGSSDWADRCTCGFSAAVNRKYGYNSGLFYEDEVDITGIRDSRFDQRKPSLLSPDYDKEEGGSKDQPPVDIPQIILELLLGQFTVPYPSTVTDNRLALLNMAAATQFTGSMINMLQLRDGSEATYHALDQGRQAMEHCSSNKLDDLSMKYNCLHKWPFLHGASCIPVNSQDILQRLKSLNPLLQDTIQNTRVMRLWEHSYKVQGPLSWKDFHQLAGRGSDQNCEPQPIPHFLVGHDRDWLSVSPYSIRYWDKQFLEPFGRQRDVAYVVVAPDNDFILSNVISFFKELSTVYELCRLGRHCPISKVLRDGIMRVGKSAEMRVAEEDVDVWFKQIGESAFAAKLKLYAQVCRHRLGPFLARQTLDKTLFESPPQKMPFKTPEPAKPTTPENSSAVTGEDNKNGIPPDGSSTGKDGTAHDLDNEDSNECPAIVVYLIDPFTYNQEWDELSRLAMIGLCRCYHEMVQYLPEHLQNNMCLQVVPLKTILNHKESISQFQTLKSVAFSVFTTCRWNLSHTIMGRSLTGFGPAAEAEMFLKKKQADEAGFVKLYSPPFILAPLKDKQAQLAEFCSEKTEKTQVLFCCYCLSEDQRWLLAACTDTGGEMMETCFINIEIPNRSRRKKASARKIGLQKLWDYIVGIVSLSTMPARLVIGRFGRLGHGELKAWSGLLSKKNLQHTSTSIKEKCSQCKYGNGDVPCVLSACLVSMEPHSSLMVMSDVYKPEEKPSSNCPLQTPRDASASHILVFPTSATAQANSHPLNPEAQLDLGNSHLELDDMLNGIGNDELGQMDHGLDFLSDLVFDDAFNTSPPVGNSPPGSPMNGDRSRQNSTKVNGQSAMSGSSMNDPQNDVKLMQQPLAMGYFVSTAQLGPLPKWFWSACPESEHMCPSVFKSALHIHTSSSIDEFLPHNQGRNSHALDSHLTCEVLRFVLEHYNALSWLTFDPAMNDRRSCLPVHVVVLMQMYHALNAFV